MSDDILFDVMLKKNYYSCLNLAHDELDFDLLTVGRPISTCKNKKFKNKSMK